MKHELKIEKKEDGTEGTLSLWGDLTMSCARESRDVLLEAIQNVDTLHLNLQDVETADVSLIQMICAASYECLMLGKRITLKGGTGKVVGELLHKSGYCKQLGCPEGDKETCLWKDSLIC